VNRDLIGDMPPGRFVSAFYAILDHDTGFLRCARAGHNPAYLVPQAGDLLELAGKGLALGLCKPGVFETKIEEYQVELPPGGLLALYTDGIVESQNEERQEFGATRFQQILRDNAALSARQLTEVVVEALRRHAMSRVPDDDHTLVLIRHLA
jgi:serine phosphatase RsbU (regulator of sigma subunit)